ncbi:MAG TPA: TetR/AcrR family transcriptional regulator [Solirubrobacterales bacterium]|jgi:AcrR family transcriptional regulator|nr:TetR/AcrR family transcriptional regulator [Solirubrobacterales bacterium]
MSPDRIRLSHEALIAAIGDSWPPAQVDAAVQLLANSEGKFPAGVRKLPGDLVSAVQRERLLAAMLKAVAEIGYRDVNVQDVLDRAGVSRPTFYEHFSNKEDCFLAAFDATAVRLRAGVAAAADEGGDNWRDRLRFGLRALLRFAVEQPDAARALIVEARGASPAAVLRRDALLEHFGARIDGKARELVPGADGSAIKAAGVVGGIETLLYSRINKGQTEDLESLLPSLMYFVVLPYEGHEVASEQMAVAAG